MNWLLTFDEIPLIDGEVELSDDRAACRLFLAALLDVARAESAEEVVFTPGAGDKSLAAVINGEVFEIVPLPPEARDRFLRFAQDITLGRVRGIVVRHGLGALARELQGMLNVQVAGRLSSWRVRGTRDSIRFQRVPETAGESATVIGS